jgi:hypothetical protein
VGWLVLVGALFAVAAVVAAWRRPGAAGTAGLGAFPAGLGGRVSGPKAWSLAARRAGEQLAAWWASYARSRRPASGAPGLEVLGRAVLAPGRYLVRVRAGEQEFFLAVGSDVRLLAQTPSSPTGEEGASLVASFREELSSALARMAQDEASLVQRLGRGS